MLVLRSVFLMPQINRAARRWTDSRRLARVSVMESQATDAYSRTGLTSCLYAVSFTDCDVVSTLRLMKPSVELALLVMLYMWVFQMIYGSRVTPRYFTVEALGISVSWSLIDCVSGFLFRENVIC